LQPIHLSLSLRSAMTLFFKLKNYDTAAGFCRRLLELNPPVKVAQQAKQVLQACERTPGDEVQLDYDSRNPFVVCAGTFVPIYRGTSSVACPCCGAKFVNEQAGQTCPVCLLGKVGAEASGLVVSPSQR
jgi:coatomer protein complex subunit alpha (xenin)